MKKDQTIMLKERELLDLIEDARKEERSSLIKQLKAVIRTLEKLNER